MPTSIRWPLSAVQVTNSPLCASRSRFGHCDRAKGHEGPHAGHIGQATWFAWRRQGRYASDVIGYRQGEE